MQHLLFAALVVVAAGPVLAQNPPAPRTPIPVKLQFVFERFQGEKRLTSEPYVLSVVANEGGAARLHAGVNVPMRMDRVNDRDVPGNVVFRSVGNLADCTVVSVDQTRYRVQCTFDQSSIAAPPGTTPTPLMPPLLRSFRTEAGVVLSDKQNVQVSSLTDPISGERLQVSLTLTVSN